MKSSKCDQTEILKRNLLSRNDPAELSPDEQKHIESCLSCQNLLARIRRCEDLVNNAYCRADKEADKLTAKFQINLEKNTSRRLTSLTSFYHYFTWPRFAFGFAIIVLFILSWSFFPFSNPEVPRLGSSSVLSKLPPSGHALLQLGKLRRTPGGLLEMGTVFKLSDGKRYSTLEPSQLKLHNGIAIIIHQGIFSFNLAGIRLIQGIVDVKVPKGKNISFSAITQSAILGVRGTEFRVQAFLDGSTFVSVSEGIVSATNLTGKERMLHAYDSTHISNSGVFSTSKFSPVTSPRIASEHILIPSHPGASVPSALDFYTE